MTAITVFLADDNVIVREGVRAMLARHADIEIVGTADDYDSLVSGAKHLAPQVVVTDIRMPPKFQSEGIEACKEIRQRHPGTGVVILSQFDDPDYAISLLSEGAAGYAYLLKDRIAEGDELVGAIRAVAGGGTVLDPSIVDSMLRPARQRELSDDQELLLEMIAEGKPIKAIAAAREITASAAEADVERLFASLAQSSSAAGQAALRRLRKLHEAIVNRDLEGGLPTWQPPSGPPSLLASGRRVGAVDRVNATVLMWEIRGYSRIAEHADLAVLAQQLSTHRAEMNRAITNHRGTVMQYGGEVMMAVFGAPEPLAEHADGALEAARVMHLAQQQVNEGWIERELPPFELGIGISTGDVGAAMLGSDEQTDYAVVGDSVNLCRRLQQLAAAGQTIVSEATWAALSMPPLGAEQMPEQLLKDRDAPVRPYRLGAVVHLRGDQMRTIMGRRESH
jgi:adenylate cyclase